MEVIITVINNGEIISNNIIEVEKRDVNSLSKYARCFDHGCHNWTDNREYNMLYLKNQQTYANDLLKARGRIFLNEVYDMLELPRTKDGCVIGWVLGSYVDFGLDNERNKDPEHRYMVLDFNVDGYILDKNLIRTERLSEMLGLFCF